jgi:hypothetical protein
VAPHSDTELQAQIQRLFVGETQLPCQLVYPDSVGQLLNQSFPIAPSANHIGLALCQLVTQVTLFFAAFFRLLFDRYSLTPSVPDLLAGKLSQMR